jgi:RNA polymerase sigma-70 factor (ECF subfamily)
MNNKNYYANLLRYAYKVTLHKEEAEDLLQTALLVAVEAKRSDLTCVKNRRWLMGVLRNQSVFNARSAARRKKREATLTNTNNIHTYNDETATYFIDSLPPSLKTTALLVLTGHCKKEIIWLLRVSDAALRQRIAEIKRRWQQTGARQILELEGLAEDLPFGQIRKALLNAPCRDEATLASHDPDGHLFMVTSQNNLARQHRVISIKKQEKNHA